MTVYTSDTETVFETDRLGKMRKVAEWRLVSDTRMEYTAYNADGSVNLHYVHEGSEIQGIWEKYHTKGARH